MSNQKVGDAAQEYLDKVRAIFESQVRMAFIEGAAWGYTRAGEDAIEVMGNAKDTPA